MTTYHLSDDDKHKIANHPAVKARILDVADQIVDNANRMAKEVSRPSERDHPNFGIYKVKHGDKFKVWVHPLGRTGIHVEAGHSVLLKAIGMVQ